MTTTIQIDDDLWLELNKNKRRKETFNDVLRRLLKIERRKVRER